MSRLTLRLRRDSVGKRSVIVDYEGDPDALPVEHENEHRRLTDRLFETAGAAARRKLTIDRPSPPSSVSLGAEDGQSTPVGQKS